MILLTGGESMERLFDLDWQMIADASLTIIAVFVLFLAMSYLLFNPARQMLQKRRQKIKDELDNARDNMEQADVLRKEYESKLKDIDQEAELILSQVRKKALDNERQIIAKAKEEATRIIERAQTEALLERQKMTDDVKNEMISIASIMAGKIITTSIDSTVQDLLIEETLKELGESTWLS